MKRILSLLVLAFGAFACTALTEPYPNGAYNQDNLTDYPNLIRGFVFRSYNLLPTSWWANEFIGLDAAADNAVYRDRANAVERFASGSAQISSHPLASVWNRDYQGIYYVNCFLQDRIGINTRYYVDMNADAVHRSTLQGDAFGMRAFFLADLLKVFGGEGTDGRLLGVPIMTEALSTTEADDYPVERATYDECVKQIFRDCDSALVYLPLANRNFLQEEPEMVPVTGAVRYCMLDGIAIHALKAQVALTWASPAFNPDGDMSRWEIAAQEAKIVLDHKLNVESADQVSGGFNPKNRFLWNSPNDPEVVFLSQIVKNETLERALYPQGFGGNGNLGVTLELAESFPDAKGYPIGHPSSVYDPEKPFENRDPRFYSTIYYDGSRVQRNNTGAAMYLFDIAEGGKDAPGGEGTSPTGLYVKKFLYTGWNSSDSPVSTAERSVIFLRWTQQCLIFAEAANHVCGPTDEGTFGLSARQAIAWLRARNTEDNKAGLGATADPYLDEVAAAGAEAFDALVRNEWRIETCLEGRRFYDLRRWATTDDALDTTLHGWDGREVAVRDYPSRWVPIPYTEIRKSDRMVQNKGWENWK